MTLAQVIALGFDESTRKPFKTVRASCSKCQAVVINGAPCHEKNCPNEKHECAGCNVLLQRGQRWCRDCL